MIILDGIIFINFHLLAAAKTLSRYADIEMQLVYVVNKVRSKF
jgi:hypothetical protein